MESNTFTMLGLLNFFNSIISQLVQMDYVDFEMSHICQMEANYWEPFKTYMHCKYSVLFDGKKIIQFILQCISEETTVKQCSDIR